MRNPKMHMEIDELFDEIPGTAPPRPRRAQAAGAEQGTPKAGDVGPEQGRRFLKTKNPVKTGS